jgi:hypothetical protein
MRNLIRKRAYVVGALALSVPLAVSGAAYGQNGVQTIDGNISPPQGSKNAALSVEVAYVPGSDGKVAHATNAFIEFPAEGKVSTKAKKKKRRSGGAFASAKTVRIPECDPASIEGTTTADAVAACGKSQVGSGSAIADVGGIDLAATVTAFNGKDVNGNDSILLHSRVEAASLTTVLVGEIRPPAGRGPQPYGYSLNVPVPPLAGGAAAIERFQTTVQEKITKDVGYISGKCGADHTYSFRGTFDFSDAPQAVVTDEQTC